MRIIWLLRTIILFYMRKDILSLQTNPFIQSASELLNKYPKKDRIGNYRELPLRRSGSNSHREDRPNLYYPLYFNHKTGELSADRKSKDQTEIYPIDSQGVKRVWRWSKDRIRKDIDTDILVKQNGENFAIYTKDRIKEDIMPKSLWVGAQYDASSHGTVLLKNILGDNDFDYPKSIFMVQDLLTMGSSSDSVVLDYFAGSGTTGHAVINLNREDNGERKYILVEMGQHFDAVLLPRLKKVIYSKDWKDGKPVSREGSGQLIKRIRLESYEDTMDSLELKQPDDGALAGNDKLAEDYRLRYALGAETAGSACLLGKTFTNPFAYTLSVVRDGARREVPVDLPETFNYLLGLRVKSRQQIDGALVIAGTDAKGQNCLIIWRDVEKMDYSALDKWFARHRREFSESLDAIYANGDHTLDAMRQNKETWVAKTIEPVFHELMFEKTLQ